MKKILVFVSLMLAGVVKADNKGVFFLSPKDGSEISSPFKAKFGVTGMKIKPVGQLPIDKTTGHFHIIVDGQPAAEGKVIPADPTHIHYGKGQTEGELKLAPGKHSLTLQFADGLHRGYGNDLVQTITVTVK